MRVRAGHGRATGNVGGVAVGGGTVGLGPLGPGAAGHRRRCFGGEGAGRVTHGQNLDSEVRAEALAEAATDAVRGLDDRVVGQDQAGLGADLDADVAALAPFVDPPDVDVVDERWVKVYPGWLRV
jgi:hypothetical protein